MLRAISSGAAGNSPVITQPATFATRTNFQTTGNIVRFTDVGGGTTNVGGGTFWYWNATRWKLVNNSADLDTIDTANSGAANTTPQNLNPNAATILPGVVRDFDRLVLELSMSKSGAADTGTFVVRLGSTFTTTDVAIATVTISGAEQSAGFRLKFKRVSATTIQRQGSSNQQNAFGGASTGAFPATITLAGTDSFDVNSMRLSLWQTMTGGTEFLTIQDMEFTLLTTDS